MFSYDDNSYEEAIERSEDVEDNRGLTRHFGDGLAGSDTDAESETVDATAGMDRADSGITGGKIAKDDEKEAKMFPSAEP